MSANGTFKPSGIVGAIRYMAPEVFLGKPYNLSIDTYSFALLLWEILALERPFADIGGFLEDFEHHVIGGGLRPTYQDEWPEPMWDMMVKSWSSDISLRPKMIFVAGMLRRELKMWTES